MKIISTLLFSCLGFCAAAQVTQAEMEKMLKEAREAVKNIDADTKKMMDSMGIKIPDVPNVPKVSDKALAEAYEEQSRLVPKKDNIRIASVLNQNMPNTAVAAFVSKIHSSLISFLPAQVKAESEQIYQWAKTEHPLYVSQVASGLWLTGNYRHALYLMSKATQNDPSNTDNLNNYAAFLTMAGAEQAALPILINLNKRFPKNSTVLNNLGQAWFGLGETARAEKYLDSAIMLFATHSQANYTKCLLEQNKGDKKKAADAMKKSIKNSYSKEKDNKLQELGHEITDKYLTWNIPIPVDALGLERFYLPKFPMNTDEAFKLENDWNAFRKECMEKMKGWDDKNLKLYPQQEQQALDEQRRLIEAVNNQKKIQSSVLVPFYHSKAIRKLKYLVDDNDGSIAYKRKKLIEERQMANAEIAELEKQMNAELTKIMKDVFVTTIPGDGGVSEEKYCSIHNGVVNKYLPQVNSILYEIQLKQLEYERKQANNLAYYNMFTMDALTFEIYKNGAKAKWLNLLAGADSKFWRCTMKLSNETKEQTSNKLPDFDDLQCNYKSTLNFFIGSFENNCSRMITKFIKGPLSFEIKENLNTGEIIRGTIEVEISKGIGSMEKGPIKAELEVGAGIQIEIEKSGISDVIVKAGAEVKMGSDVINEGPDKNKTVLPPGVGDKSITVAGIEVRYGWNSGGAVEGKGILKGMKF